MRFTKEQQAVVQSNEQKILVKAGAGTGKTEVLTQRILHLIDIEPTLSIKDIAIITFTNKATEELQEAKGEMNVTLLLLSPACCHRRGR